MLLQAGADVTATDSRGVTAADVAAAAGNAFLSRVFCMVWPLPLLIWLHFMFPPCRDDTRCCMRAPALRTARAVCAGYVRMRFGNAALARRTK
jgi:hypothetical protein